MECPAILLVLLCSETKLNHWGPANPLQPASDWGPTKHICGGFNALTASLIPALLPDLHRKASEVFAFGGLHLKIFF